MIFFQGSCCAPLHRQCSIHHGHRNDSEITPWTCDAIGERAQVILGKMSTWSLLSKEGQNITWLWGGTLSKAVEAYMDEATWLAELNRSQKAWPPQVLAQVCFGLLQCCCFALLHEECPQHHGHKENSRVTLIICGAIGEKVWVRIPNDENALWCFWIPPSREPKRTAQGLPWRWYALASIQAKSGCYDITWVLWIMEGFGSRVISL